MTAQLEKRDPGSGFTMADPDFIQFPFADYQWMLEERPAWRDPSSGFVVVTRYNDVRGILMDPATWSSRTSQIFNRASSVSHEVQALYETGGWLPMDTLVTNDAPEHRHYRSLVERALSPARIKTVQHIIDTTVDRLVIDMLRRGQVEFMDSFAIPLTMTMLSSQIAGAAIDDIDRIRHWTELMMEAINPVLEPQRELEITREVLAFQHYVAQAIERLRENPDQTILSDLVHAELDGQKLSVREIIAIATQFFGAGHDTTTSALGSAVRYLAEHPQDHQMLRDHPEKIPTFIEEILRLEAPIQRLFRRATKDTEVAGMPVRCGELAIIQYGGANRDERRFTCPATMDADRKDAASHLTFGAGVHFCVGNQLARAELRTAAAAIITRCARIRLADGDNSFAYHMQFISRSLSRLEIEVTPA